MIALLQKFLAFFLPILRRSAIEVAADELARMAQPNGRRPKVKPYYPQYASYASYADMAYNMGQRPTSYDRRETTYKEASEGFHDVLMVAFDVSGDNAEQVHTWLQNQMPECGEHASGYIRGGSPINLDSWWVANDDRFDGSDCDSAVFVTQGNQEAARVLLREAGLVN